MKLHEGPSVAELQLSVWGVARVRKGLVKGAWRKAPEICDGATWISKEQLVAG